MKILFIGNSYTYYNDMPTAIFEPFLKDAGFDLSVTAVTKGGYTLSRFADPSDEHGKRVEEELCGEKKYDLVILQEQSVLPAKDEYAFFTSAKNLAERIRKIGASVVLYSTWGRKSGSKVLEDHGWTNEEMTRNLSLAYQKLADEIGASVAHVGLAFYDVFTNHPEIELYSEDKSHPSYSGSYLAAVMLASRIFGIDPSAVSYRGELKKEEAEILKNAAKKALGRTPDTI